MITAQQIIFACWITFMLYWLISAGSVKSVRETKGWLGGNWYTILLLIGFLFIVRSRLATFGMPVPALAIFLVPRSTVVNVLAAALAIAGLIVAIIARKTLAENWSGAVALKQGHELITTGLYHHVRNPIYSGVLLMMLGTALSYGTLSACIGFLIIVLTVWLKLRDEEKLLTKHFSEEYLAYKKRTKTLVPFVW